MPNLPKHQMTRTLQQNLHDTLTLFMVCQKLAPLKFAVTGVVVKVHLVGIFSMFVPH